MVKFFGNIFVAEAMMAIPEHCRMDEQEIY